MVAQHYRWDFIGLSTDQKPTPATSEKVVDGSTFYCSDNSKLYVYYKDQWYEKTATGGGGGSYAAGTGITIADDTISVDTTTIQSKLTAGSNITISEDTISATDTTYSNFTGTDGTSAGASGLVPAPATTDAGKFLKADGTWDTAGGGGGAPYGRYELTEADLNWNSSTGDQTEPYDSIALWLMPFGSYYIDNASRASADRIRVYVYKNMQAYYTLYLYTAYDVLSFPEETNKLRINCYGSGGDGDSYGRQMIRQYGVNTDGTFTWTQYSLVTKEQLDNTLPETISSAPTTSTSGTVGKFYIFNDNGTYRLFMCMAYNSGTSEYIWKEVTLT